MMRALIVLVLSAVVTVNAATVLPANRTPGGHGSWTNIAGIPGGIPARPTNSVASFTNWASPVSHTVVEDWADAAPSNSVGQLGPWTNTWTSYPAITTDGITIRGTTNQYGQPITKIISSSKGIHFGGVEGATWYNEWSAAPTTNRVNWTNNYTQGTNVIKVDSVTRLTVGQIVYLDQNNTEDFTAYSPANPSGPWVTGEYTSPSYPNQGRDRVQHQINMVVSISGNDVTLLEPIYADNWASANDPELWWLSSFTPSAVVRMSGIEDIQLETDNDDITVSMQGTAHCWARNVWAREGNTVHLGTFYMTQCLRPEIRHCYLHEAAGPLDRYGIHTRGPVSGPLIIDNIASGHMTLLMINGAQGGVYAYNYAHTNLDQNISGYATAGVITHGGSPNYGLLEGNWTPQIALDSQWQNSYAMTVHRGRHPGKYAAAATTGNISAIGIFQTNRYVSVIGSILGRSGFDTLMVSGEAYGSPCADGDRIFYLGYRTGGDGGCNGTIAGGEYDPQVLATLTNAVNWTSATTTNSGVLLGGFTTNDLVNSYFLTAKPSWFGTNDYPVNPVTAGAAIAAVELPTHFPAAYRMNFSFINGGPGVDPPAAAEGGGSSAPTGAAMISGTVQLSNGVTIRQ